MLTRSTVEAVVAALREYNPDLANQFIVEFNSQIKTSDLAEYLHDGWNGGGSWGKTDEQAKGMYKHLAGRAIFWLGARAFTKRDGDEQYGVAVDPS